MAEGLDQVLSAKRYLGIDHGNQAVAAHRQVVDQVRAIARRRNESAWRLIGLAIRLQNESNRPTLDDFVAERGLDGWSESEVSDMYQEAYPQDQRGQRQLRLRERQIELLRQLENLAAEQPRGTDLVSGWFDEITASRLIGAGMLTLADLSERIAIGGRWYSKMPACGIAKASRIESHLATLIGRPVGRDVQKPAFALTTTPSLLPVGGTEEPFLTHRSGQVARGGERFPPPDLSGQFAQGCEPFTPPEMLTIVNTKSVNVNLNLHSASFGPLLDARSDHEAVQAWIAARAGSEATVKVYRREATRLLLWLQYERDGKTFSQMNVADCRDFMAFLQNVPSRWISRDRIAPGQPGWTPFRGQLSHSSCHQAVTIVSSLFAWLLSAQYLDRNAWSLVNRKTGDDKGARLLDTKAISEPAFAQILAFIVAQPPSPSRSRIEFILRFVESVGLRSAELISAKLGDFRHENEGWVLQVHGKGAKNRIAAIPGQALDALQNYLHTRDLGSIEEAPAQAPLLASTKDPFQGIGYQALYETVKAWISKAVSASDLPVNERVRLASASTHWLRHSFGTRAVAREVPLDVIQAQLGHANIQTTMNVYGRAPLKRRADELGKAFG